MHEDPIYDLLTQRPFAVSQVPMSPLAIQISQASNSDLVKSLSTRFKLLVESHDFKAGDIVKWKPGLKHLTYPADNKPAIVIEALRDPMVNTTVGPESPFFGEVLDLRIGVIMDDGGFYAYAVSSQRFELFERA